MASLSSSLNPDILEQLRQFDSPTVSNVIELFGIRPQDTGYIGPEIQPLWTGAGPVVGFASTATFRASEPGKDEAPAAGLLRHIEVLEGLSGPRVAVFQDLDESPRAATFGELMAQAYRAAGVAGIITSGAVRDLAAVRAAGLPVFARGVCVSHGYGRIVEVHPEIIVGGARIRAGDLLHADENGVVIIPAEIAADVARFCGEWVAAERDFLKTLEKGGIAAYPEVLKELQGRLAKLAARLAGSCPRQIGEPLGW